MRILENLKGKASLWCRYQDGEDERLLGQAIKGIPRERLVIASKTDKRDGKSARAELEQSLESLGVDYLDIIHIHFLNTAGERDEALGPGGAFEALEQARTEGKVRFIGVTGHDWDQVAKAVATGKFDTVLCWYNCALRQAESTVFEEAQKHNTGVVIMNASARGGAGGTGLAGTVVKDLSTTAGAPAQEQFYRYVLSHPAVSSSVMGLRDIKEFKHVARAIAERDTLTAAEKLEMEQYGAARLAATVAAVTETPRL